MDCPLYNCKIKHYPNGTRKITIFNKPIYNPDKIPLFDNEMRIIKLKQTLALKKEQDFDEIIERRSDSLKRSKDKIFDIAFANIDFWTHMVTFTLNKEVIDRYNSVEVSKKISQWLQDKSRRNGLVYIVVPELHKKGGIHYHGLIKGDGLKMVDSGYRDKSKRKIYNIKDYPFGFSTAVPLDKDTQFFVCKYITKYVSKGGLDVLPKSYYAGGKGLCREIESTYALVDFNEEFKDVEPLKVPNSDMEVKYITLGVL